MSRRTPVTELLEKEAAPPSSPVRRSARLSAVASPSRVLTRKASADEAATTPKPTRSRRLSYDEAPKSEKIKTRRGSASAVLEEEPVKTPRTRRSSAAKDLEQTPVESKTPKRGTSEVEVRVTRTRAKSEPKTPRNLTPVKKISPVNVTKPLAAIEESVEGPPEVKSIKKAELAKAILDLSLIEEEGEKKEADEDSGKKIQEESFHLELSPTPVNDKENISPAHVNVFAEKMSVSMVNQLEVEPMEVDSPYTRLSLGRSKGLVSINEDSKSLSKDLVVLLERKSSDLSEQSDSDSMSFKKSLEHFKKHENSMELAAPKSTPESTFSREKTAKRLKLSLRRSPRAEAPPTDCKEVASEIEVIDQEVASEIEVIDREVASEIEVINQEVASEIEVIDQEIVIEEEESKTVELNSRDKSLDKKPKQEVASPVESDSDQDIIIMKGETKVASPVESDSDQDIIILNDETEDTSNTDQDIIIINGEISNKLEESEANQPNAQEETQNSLEEAKVESAEGGKAPFIESKISEELPIDSTNPEEKESPKKRKSFTDNESDEDNVLTNGTSPKRSKLSETTVSSGLAPNEDKENSICDQKIEDPKKGSSTDDATEKLTPKPVTCFTESLEKNSDENEIAADCEAEAKKSANEIAAQVQEPKLTIDSSRSEENGEGETILSDDVEVLSKTEPDPTESEEESRKLEKSENTATTDSDLETQCIKVSDLIEISEENPKVTSEAVSAGEILSEENTETNLKQEPTLNLKKPDSDIETPSREGTETTGKSPSKAISPNETLAEDHSERNSKQPKILEKPNDDEILLSDSDDFEAQTKEDPEPNAENHLEETVQLSKKTLEIVVTEYTSGKETPEDQQLVIASPLHPSKIKKQKRLDVEREDLDSSRRSLLDSFDRLENSDEEAWKTLSGVFEEENLRPESQSSKEDEPASPRKNIKEREKILKQESTDRFDRRNTYVVLPRRKSYGVFPKRNAVDEDVWTTEEEYSTEGNEEEEPDVSTIKKAPEEYNGSASKQEDAEPTSIISPSKKSSESNVKSTSLEIVSTLEVQPSKDENSDPKWSSNSLQTISKLSAFTSKNEIQESVFNSEIRPSTTLETRKVAKRSRRSMTTLSPPGLKEPENTGISKIEPLQEETIDVRSSKSSKLSAFTPRKDVTEDSTSEDGVKPSTSLEKKKVVKRSRRSMTILSPTGLKQPENTGISKIEHLQEETIDVRSSKSSKLSAFTPRKDVTEDSATEDEVKPSTSLEKKKVAKRSRRSMTILSPGLKEPEDTGISKIEPLQEETIDVKRSSKSSKLSTFTPRKDVEDSASEDEVKPSTSLEKKKVAKRSRRSMAILSPPGLKEPEDTGISKIEPLQEGTIDVKRSSKSSKLSAFTPRKDVTEDSATEDEVKSSTSLEKKKVAKRSRRSMTILSPPGLKEPENTGISKIEPLQEENIDVKKSSSKLSAFTPRKDVTKDSTSESEVKPSTSLDTSKVSKRRKKSKKPKEPEHTEPQTDSPTGTLEVENIDATKSLKKKSKLSTSTPKNEPDETVSEKIKAKKGKKTSPGLKDTEQPTSVSELSEEKEKYDFETKLPTSARSRNVTKRRRIGLSQQIIDEKINKLLREVSESSEGSEEEIALNEFLDDMAEEGEEDTPSEGSNDIVEVGEEINTTESEITTDEEIDEEDSFIDNEDYELLSGEGDDLSTSQPKKSRIIDVECDSDDVIKIEKPKKKLVKKKRSRIIKPETSSSDEEIEEKIAPQPSKGLNRKIIVHENVLVQDIQNKRVSDQIQEVINVFCSGITPNKSGRVSMNLQLDYKDKSESLEDEVFEPDYKIKRKRGDVSALLATPSEVGKKFKFGTPAPEPEPSEPKKNPKRQMEASTSIVPKKKKKTSKTSVMNDALATSSQKWVPVLRPSSPMRAGGEWEIKFLPSRAEQKAIECSTSEGQFVKRFHGKDFKNQMIYDAHRAKRVDTKKVLKRRGVN